MHLAERQRLGNLGRLSVDAILQVATSSLMSENIWDLIDLQASLFDLKLRQQFCQKPRPKWNSSSSQPNQ